MFQEWIDKELLNQSDFEKYKKIVIIVVIIAVLMIYMLGIRCEAGVCLLPSSLNGDYCIVHTCDRNSCYNKVAKGKTYCYTHLPSTSTKYNYTPEVANDVLIFSDININQNSSYSTCVATITNNGKKTYTFVKVKGKFEDSSGTILDTDCTYAVGAEGLSPGESVVFKLSVYKNINIVKCELEIIDYDKE